MITCFGLVQVVLIIFIPVALGLRSVQTKLTALSRYRLPRGRNCGYYHANEVTATVALSSSNSIAADLAPPLSRKYIT